ncbi:MAG TPA: alpha/beta fold hydrolase [Candidatus Brocadiia bacterium]|nr:alpha/beta fold hydrolase [Candidatus Brocadiia bacterium]
MSVSLFASTFLFLALCGIAAADGGIPAAEDGAVERDVAFTSDCDGSEQRYVLILPGGFDPEKRRDVLIALHGHGSDRWQFVRDPRDECRATRDAAAKHGMIFVSPDYRAKTSWMGPKAESDLVQIIVSLRREFSVGDVILCGGSMGGAACLTFAALHPGLVDGVVSMNGTANLVEYPNFLDAIAESFGGGKTQVPEEYRKRSAEFFPQRLTMPIAFTVGGKDESVPPQSVLRLAEALKKTNRNALLIHDGNGGHVTSYADAAQALDFVIVRATGDAPGSARHFEQEVRAIEERDRSNPPPAGATLFAGSSSIRMWATLAGDMKPMTVINHGFGGSQLPDVLHYMDRLVMPVKPSRIVLYCGENDIQSGRTPQQVADDFRSFVAVVREHGIAGPICYVSMKPSPSRWVKWPDFLEGNRLIRESCDRGQGLFYIDVAQAMLGQDGRLLPDIWLEDKLHMNEKGYRIWTPIIRAALDVTGKEGQRRE